MATVDATTYSRKTEQTNFYRRLEHEKGSHHLIICALGLGMAIAAPVWAGGVDNKHNWSAEYIRTLNRNAAIDAAAIAAYNPAGTVMMQDGAYVNLSVHDVLKTYTNRVNGTDLESDVPSYVPGLFGVYKLENWSVFGSFTIPGGGSEVEYDDGNATTNAAGLGMMAMANGMLDANAVTLAGLGIADPALVHYSGINRQSLDGNSYYYGFTLGGAYRVNDMVALSLGARYIKAQKEAQGLIRITAADSTLGTIAGVNDDEGEYPFRSRRCMIKSWKLQLVLYTLLAALIIRERCRSLMNGFRMKQPVLRICCCCVGQRDLFVLPVEQRNRSAAPHLHAIRPTHIGPL